MFDVTIGGVTFHVEASGLETVLDTMAHDAATTRELLEALLNEDTPVITFHIGPVSDMQED